MTDAAVAKTAVDSANGRLAITSTALIFPVPVGLAVAKCNAELGGKITAAIQQMKDNGKYQALLEKCNLAEPSSE